MQEQLWRQARLMIAAGVILVCSVCLAAAFIFHEGTVAATSAQSEGMRQLKMKEGIAATALGVGMAARAASDAEVEAALATLANPLRGFDAMGIDSRRARSALEVWARTSRAGLRQTLRRTEFQTAVGREAEGIRKASLTLNEPGWRNELAVSDPIAYAALTEALDQAHAAIVVSWQLFLPPNDVEPARLEQVALAYCREAGRMLAGLRFPGRHRMAIESAREALSHLETLIAGGEGIRTVSQAAEVTERARSEALSAVSVRLDELISAGVARGRVPIAEIADSSVRIYLSALGIGLLAGLGSIAWGVWSAGRCRSWRAGIAELESRLRSFEQLWGATKLSVQKVAAELRALSGESASRALPGAETESIEIPHCGNEVRACAASSAAAAGEAERLIQSALRSAESLTEAASGIAGLTNSMKSLSFRTNLLALNASIEAAHAGSAGAGFGIMAGEVREVAAASAESAREIAQRAEQFDQDTFTLTQAVSGISDALRRVRESQVLIESLAAGGLSARKNIARIPESDTMCSQIIRLAAELEGLPGIAPRAQAGQGPSAGFTRPLRTPGPTRGRAYDRMEKSRRRKA